MIRLKSIFINYFLRECLISHRTFKMCNKRNMKFNWFSIGGSILTIRTFIMWNGSATPKLLGNLSAICLEAKPSKKWSQIFRKVYKRKIKKIGAKVLPDGPIFLKTPRMIKTLTNIILIKLSTSQMISKLWSCKKHPCFLLWRK